MPFAKSHFSVSLNELLPLSEEKTKETSGFRPVSMKAGVFVGLRGSACVEFGDTRVLAQVNGPKESNEGDFHSGAIGVNIIGYEEKKLRPQMISALSGVVQLRKYAKSLINVDITVLNADGGVLQAALLASSLALMHAGIEVLDIVLPCHVSLSNNSCFILDPIGESSTDLGDLTIAILPNINQIVCCDIRGTIPRSLIKEAIIYAQKNCYHLYPSVRQAIVDSIC